MFLCLPRKPIRSFAIAVTKVDATERLAYGAPLQHC